MDFGIIDSGEIQNVNFILPPDGSHTLAMFGNQKKSLTPDLRIGLAKWGRKEWVGKLYPDRTLERDFFAAYAKLFDTIELNAVFYSIPPEDLILKWKGMIAQNHKREFLLLPKMSRVITHIKRLNNAENETAQYINTLKLFGPHLGPILIQIGDNFGPKKLLDLELFIKGLPTDQKFMIELRQQDWFSDPFHRKTVFDIFSKYNIGTVITDSPGRRDCLHMELTTPEAYIRFNGIDNEHSTIDYLRIDDWVDRIKIWLDLGLEKVYFIISQKADVDTPRLAEYAIHRFNEKLGANIPEIQWKANAAMTNVAMLPGHELIVKHITRDIQNGRGEVID